MDYNSLSYHSSRTERSEITPKLLVSKVNAIYSFFETYIIQLVIYLEPQYNEFMKAANSPQTEHHPVTMALLREALQ